MIWIIVLLKFSLRVVNRWLCCCTAATVPADQTPLRSDCCRADGEKLRSLWWHTGFLWALSLCLSLLWSLQHSRTIMCLVGSCHVLHVSEVLPVSAKFPSCYWCVSLVLCVLFVQWVLCSSCACFSPCSPCVCWALFTFFASAGFFLCSHLAMFTSANQNQHVSAGFSSSLPCIIYVLSMFFRCLLGSSSSLCAWFSPCSPCIG